MPTKTKSSPLEQRLRADRERLTAQIEDVERRIEAAILESGKRVVDTAAGSLAEESALRPLSTLKTRREVLQAALAEVDRRLADAPKRQREFDAAKDKLATALEARQAVQDACSDAFRELHGLLMKLRLVNADSVAALREALKAWQRAGRLPEETPRFAALKWPNDLLVLREWPLVELGFVGDRSRPMARFLPGAYDDAALASTDLELEE